jgi:hypothetical protein
MTEAWELDVIECPRCEGTGEFGGMAADRCVACAGKGRLTKQAWNKFVDYLDSLQSPAWHAANDADHLRSILATLQECRDTLDWDALAAMGALDDNIYWLERYMKRLHGSRGEPPTQTVEE